MQEIREVVSLPNQDHRNWTATLVLTLFLLGSILTFTSRDIVYFSTAMALFTGWLMSSGVSRQLLSVWSLAIFTGVILACLIDAMTFGQSVLERGMDNIV